VKKQVRMMTTRTYVLEEILEGRMKGNLKVLTLIIDLSTRKKETEILPIFRKIVE